jgi:hypothetical protein
VSPETPTLHQLRDAPLVRIPQQKSLEESMRHKDPLEELHKRNIKASKDKIARLAKENHGGPITRRQELAQKRLNRLINEGLRPLAPDVVTVTKLPDLIFEDGMINPMVEVRWKYGRTLSYKEIGIIGYCRDNCLITNQRGLVFGFQGREVDYADYCAAGDHPYGKEVEQSVPQTTENKN